MTDMRIVVRFDRLLTELHIADDGKTRCGQEMPEGDTRVIWIDWTDDGTPHCAECYGIARQEEAMF